ncbi:MAG: type VI secretion system contractile sheath small subunit [Acidobacteriota bacterium]
MSESLQHWLDRNRPPRVQITYDVETLGAIEKIELPLVVGILADLSGKPENPAEVPKLKDRKFVEIDRDNIDDVMKTIKPRLALSVTDVLSETKEGEEPKKISAVLEFESREDFSPFRVARQVPALAQLLDARQRLNDLLAKLDGNDELNDLLQDVAQETDKLDTLKKEAASRNGDTASEPAADAGDAGKADAKKADAKKADKKGDS